MAVVFRLAQRTNAKPLIGFFGQSGSGKTFSALLLARGFVGREGKIAMVETEGGRGEAFVGYDGPEGYIGPYYVVPLEGNFAPPVYEEAIGRAEKEKADALLIDSASHEWEGTGGVLDIAAATEARVGKKGLIVWKDAKTQHGRFVRRLMQTPIPLVIVNMRAKFKSRQTKKGGETEIVRDEFTTAIQADDFIFEMMAHAEILMDHKLRVTKVGVPWMKPIFTSGMMIGNPTGEALAAGAAAQAAKGGDKPSPSLPPPKQASADSGPSRQDADWEAVLDSVERAIASKKSAPALREFWDRDLEVASLKKHAPALARKAYAKLQARVEAMRKRA